MNMEDRDDPRNGDTKFVDHVTAPGNLKIFTKAPDEGAHCIELYTSPGMPGFTNLSTRQMIIKTKDGKAPLSGRVARDSQIKVSISFVVLIMDTCNYSSYAYHIILYYLYRLGFVPHLEVTQVVQSYHYQQVSQSRCSPCPYSREEPPPRVHYYQG